MTMESPMQPKRGSREALVWLGPVLPVVGVVKGGWMRVDWALEVAVRKRKL